MPIQSIPTAALQANDKLHNPAVREQAREAAVMSDDGRFILELKVVTERLAKAGMGISRSQVRPGVSYAEALKDENQDYIVGATSTVVELGHPITTSFCLGMMTPEEELIARNQVTVVGKELEELPRGRHSFALVVLAQVAKATETARHALMKSILSLDLLVGCTARVSSNRIWIRFGEEAFEHRLALKDVGAFLVSELKNHGFGVTEVLLITGTADQVNELGAVAQEMAEERSARFREALTERMACESGEDCDECPETDTCRVLKGAVVAARRKTGLGVRRMNG